MRFPCYFCARKRDMDLTWDQVCRAGSECTMLEFQRYRMAKPMIRRIVTERTLRREIHDWIERRARS